MCETAGNYGSTVFDSQDGEKLAFNICDPCMVAKGREGLVRVYRKTRPIVTGFGSLGHCLVGQEILEHSKYRTWNPAEDRDPKSVYVTLDELDRLGELGKVRHCPPGRYRFELYMTPAEARRQDARRGSEEPAGASTHPVAGKTVRSPAENPDCHCELPDLAHSGTVCLHGPETDPLGVHLCCLAIRRVLVGGLGRTQIRTGP